MKCPVHNIPDCSPLLNGCSRLTAPMVEPDGSNPLARIDLSSDMDGVISPVCDCGAILPLPTNIEVNLQDLVMAAGDHARVCPLHLANLAAIEKEKTRD